MEWNHILNKRPESGQVIIQLDPPYQFYNSDFKLHYSMGMRLYKEYGNWEDYITWCRKNDMNMPDFWWIYAKDFPFPNQPERSKREDS